MKNLSLSTRLFFSCFLVSALLFSGIYFYVKGFNETRGVLQARDAFDRAQGHLIELVRARGGDPAALVERLEKGKASIARAELDTAGLTFLIQRDGKIVASGLRLDERDERTLTGVMPLEPLLVNLSSGRYLVRSTGTGGLVLLYPLSELDRAARELLQAFLVAGIALLFLTMIVAQILSREISRPLTTLRNRVRTMATLHGLVPPPATGDEVGDLTASILEFTQHLETAFQHKELALDELETYKAELLRVNTTLRRRLFQVKVLLSLWSERDNSLGVKDFLARFLEALLPGLPFEYGCVIIRPIADMGSETIFAKKVPFLGNRDQFDENAEQDGSTLWTDILDPAVREFLLRESTLSMESSSVRMSNVVGCVRAGSTPTAITVLSFRLQRGEEPLGSVHFLTENAAPAVSPSLNEFLVNLSTQVSAQLQIQALSYATRLDPLTRLYNRGYLNDRLREEVVRCSRKREPFSLVLLDIDHFRFVNEKFGQRAADEVLRGVASLLKATCRGSDAVCRFQGPVLAIVLADTALPGAKIFAENVRKAVEARPFPIPDGGDIPVTVSLGIAAFPTDGDGVEALIASADRALATAKESGRNTWRAA